MDNQRLLVWAAFGLLVFMTWQAWQQDYGPKPQPAAPVASETTATQETDSLPSLDSATQPAGDVPSLTPEAAAPAATSSAQSPVISVSTDVFDIDISTRGGVLVRAVLKKYPVAKDQPDVLVELLSRNELRFGSLQAGLIGEVDGQQYFDADLTSLQTRYELNGADELVVPLRFSAGGVEIEKQFIFRRGSYRIDVQHIVRNESAAGFRTAAYSVLKRRSVEQER